MHDTEQRGVRPFGECGERREEAAHLGVPMGIGRAKIRGDRIDDDQARGAGADRVLNRGGIGELHGALARATAPLHWALFAAGAYGFARLRSWIWPWASVYGFYVALSHLVWSEASPNGQGWPIGLLQAALLSIPGWLLLRARPPARAPGVELPLTR